MYPCWVSLLDAPKAKHDGSHTVCLLTRRLIFRTSRRQQMFGRDVAFCTTACYLACNRTYLPFHCQILMHFSSVLLSTFHTFLHSTLYLLSLLYFRDPLCRFANYCCVLVYKLSLLSRPRAQELYRTESLQPPGYSVTAGVQRTVSKRHPVFHAVTCVPEGRFPGRVLCL